MSPNVLNGEKEAICRANIFSASEKEYGPQYKEHLLEQYKLYLQSVIFTSDLKLKINTYFLAINTALFTAIGIIFSKSTLNPIVWHFILPLAGMVISFVWLGVTYAYKERSVVKLRIIHCIEEKLPLATHTTEWQLINERHANRFGRFFFNIDLFIPLIFMAAYILFIVLI
ncbi:MAG: hypothetical protein A3B13_01370 [Candidatus Liptonbacteria bacterium RIFCSPLOWO2_01_FULL_45_15]|uniref:Small integral membrane protein n=1 Tax=Candidatus Liptonbacteria bacterium RIFCSPLOWO2_01_FULL_45_15 TaxID=1798649 RepID=A0A1G2CE85_9BACT|nr:MAG: hypothetical protein A3B13_01370 [Candidatus Liptonbacteria bacterium RIFCSPLOWO2_01_FULL_45_15]